MIYMDMVIILSYVIYKNLYKICVKNFAINSGLEDPNQEDPTR